MKCLRQFRSRKTSPRRGADLPEKQYDQQHRTNSNPNDARLSIRPFDDKTGENPVHNVDKKLDGRTHKSFWGYTRVGVVSGCTVAHNVGKGYRKPTKSVDGLSPGLIRRLPSRRPSPTLHLHAASLSPCTTPRNAQSPYDFPSSKHKADNFVLVPQTRPILVW